MGSKIVIWALIAGILLCGSCIPWGWAVYIHPPGITGDNSGGAIVTYAVYETLTEQDYYVQRINPEGDFLWGGKGVLIGSTGNGIPYSKTVSDGSGGAIVTWGGSAFRRYRANHRPVKPTQPGLILRGMLNGERTYQALPRQYPMGWEESLLPLMTLMGTYLFSR